MSFNPSESAVDKVEQTEGLSAAYDLFTNDINGIKQTSSPQKDNAQKKSLTDDLSKRGVLPDLAIGGIFDGYIGIFDGGWGKQGLSGESRWLKDFKESQELREKLSAQDGRLFKQIARIAGDESQISFSDITKLLNSDDLAKRFSGNNGDGFLSKEDRSVIECLKRDWNKPYMQGMKTHDPWMYDPMGYLELPVKRDWRMIQDEPMDHRLHQDSRSSHGPRNDDLGFGKGPSPK